SEAYSVVTFQIPTGTYVSATGGADRQNAGNKDKGNFQYRNLKLERGTKATDWTPAPEDTDAKITHVESEFTQKYDSITSTVSSLDGRVAQQKDRKSTRLNCSHVSISYAVFCLKKKMNI